MALKISLRPKAVAAKRANAQHQKVVSGYLDTTNVSASVKATLRHEKKQEEKRALTFDQFKDVNKIMCDLGSKADYTGLGVKQTDFYETHEDVIKALNSIDSLWNFKFTPMPHQQHCVKTMIQPLQTDEAMGKRFLAMGAGSGKTICVVAAFCILLKDHPDNQMIYVCQKKAVDQVVAEIRRVSYVSVASYVNTNKLKVNREDLRNLNIIVTTYETIKAEIVRQGNFFEDMENPTILTLDEGHVLRNSENKCHMLVKEFIYKLNFYRFWFLSGTPVINGYNDMRSYCELLRILDHPFKEHIIKAHPETFEMFRKKYMFIVNINPHDRVFTRSIGIPDMHERYVTVSQRTVPDYALAMAHLVVDIEKRMAIHVQGRQVLRFITRLRQCADSLSLHVLDKSPKIEESPKLIYLLNSIKQMAPGQKGIVYSNFLTMVYLVAEYLESHGISCIMYHGQIPYSRRGIILQKFHTEPYQILVTTTKSSGDSLNITCANHAWHMDGWFNKAGDVQASKRLHRIGQKLECHITHIIMEGSVEKAMLFLQAKKLQATQDVLGKNSVHEESSINNEERVNIVCDAIKEFKRVYIEEYTQALTNPDSRFDYIYVERDEPSPPPTAARSGLGAFEGCRKTKKKPELVYHSGETSL